MCQDCGLELKVKIAGNRVARSSSNLTKFKEDKVKEDNAPPGV